MTENQPRTTGGAASDADLQESRRAFLIGTGKWSKAVIAAILLGGGVLSTERDASARSWINRRGGPPRPGRGTSWADGRGGGWANRRGGGSWANRR